MNNTPPTMFHIQDNDMYNKNFEEADVHVFRPYVYKFSTFYKNKQLPDQVKNPPPPDVRRGEILR